MKLLKRLLLALVRGHEEGQSLIEYLIIIGACSLVGIAGFTRYGQSVKKDLGADARHIEGEGLPSTEGILGSLGADYNELPGWCVKPNYCFAKGTPVQTETGDRPIESVRVGDRIWSRDVKTGAIALRPVVNTYRTPSVPVIDLELSASHTAIEQLAVTRGHLFWVEGAGWVRADALAAQPLWSTEAELGAHLIREEPEATTVYNLEVSEFHSYFVGHSHVLVHNGDPESCVGDSAPKTAEKSDYCPPGAPYKSGDLCCSDENLQHCDCAAQINKTGHELEAQFLVGDERVDIKAVPGACSSEKDSCSTSSGVSVNVQEDAIQDELQKNAFTSICGGSSKPIKPGAFLAKQQNKESWKTLSDRAKAYFIAFDGYCSLLSETLGGKKGNTAAPAVSRDPRVVQRVDELLRMYKKLEEDKKLSDEITNTGGNALHTEPKAIAYLKHWRDNGGKSLEGGTFNMTGTLSPCAQCARDLEGLAKDGVTVNYCFDVIYRTGPARKNAGFFAAESGPANCSIAYRGCVQYSPTGGLSFSSQKGQKPLCATGPRSCDGG